MGEKPAEATLYESPPKTSIWRREVKWAWHLFALLFTCMLLYEAYQCFFSNLVRHGPYLRVPVSLYPYLGALVIGTLASWVAVGMGKQWGVVAGVVAGFLLVFTHFLFGFPSVTGYFWLPLLSPAFRRSLNLGVEQKTLSYEPTNDT